MAYTVTYADALGILNRFGFTGPKARNAATEISRLSTMRVKGLNDKLVAAYSDISAANTQIASLQAEVARLNDEIAALTSGAEGDEQTIADLQAQVTGLSAQVQTLSAQAAADAASIIALEALIAELEAQLAGSDKGLKPVMAGLATRSGDPAAAYQPVFTAKGYEVWASDINPSPGVYNFAAIEAALDDADARGIQARIRIFCGRRAPVHAKNLAGGPVHIIDPWDGNVGDVPCWWKQPVIDWYVAMHTAVAAAYDDDPRMLEVSASLTTTIYAEPLMRQTGSPETRANLLAKGYTRALDEAAIRAMLSAHDVYARTRTGFACNVAQFVKADGTGQSDVTFSKTIMTYARDTLGLRACLQNNSLDDPANNVATENTMYSHMQTLGGPIAFQSLAASRFTSKAQFVNMLNYAISLGASLVELSPGGWGGYMTVAEAESFAERLAGNA